MPLTSKPAVGLIVATVGIIAALSPTRAQEASAAAMPLSLAEIPASTGPARGSVAPFSLSDGVARVSQPVEGAAPEGVDERALRYYASQKDVARVAAEIKRLRSKHPEWMPPADLMSGGQADVDEQPLWDLYGAGRYDEIRAKVAAIKAEKPGWRPSSEFVAKFDAAQIRAALVRASDAKDWRTVLALAGRSSTLLQCSDIDSIWRVAEALGKVGDASRALSAYQYILANCTGAAERHATVQKASLVVSPAVLDGLIAQGGIGPEGRNEFEGVRADILRARLGKAASGDGLAAPSQADLEGFERAAIESGLAGDAQLLGWFHLAQRKYDVAADWFRRALDRDQGAKNAEGLTLALRDGGKLLEAEEVGYRWRAADPLVSKAYVETVLLSLTAEPPRAIEAPRLARFEEAVGADRSAVGAQVYGWYLFKQDKVAAARSWFERSVEWSPTEQGVVGLAVTAERLRDLAALKSVVERYKGQFPALADMVGGRQTVVSRNIPRGQKRRAETSWDSAADEAVALYKAGKYQEALAAMDMRAGRRKEPRGLTIVRGWALYNSGQWSKAQETFAAAEKIAPGKDSREGFRVARDRQLPPWMR